MRSPFHLRASAVAVFALSLAACTDTDPMAAAIRVNQAAPAVLLRAATASNLQLCVTDVLERITPALEQSDELNKVKSSLLDVGDALDKRSLPPLAGASRSFKDAVDKYMTADETRGFDPDAAVLRILSEDLESVVLNPPLDTVRIN